jgi:hypothetical protein
MRNSHRSSWYTVCFGCLGLLLSWPRVCHAAQLDLLALVREGHRAARQSIHNFSATVTDKITFSDQVAMSITAKYWRSFDVVRIREKQGRERTIYCSEMEKFGKSAVLWNPSERKFSMSPLAEPQSKLSLGAMFGD